MNTQIQLQTKARTETRTETKDKAVLNKLINQCAVLKVVLNHVITNAEGELTSQQQIEQYNQLLGAQGLVTDMENLALTGVDRH